MSELCITKQGSARSPNETKHWRPLIHFTPAKNWINDPNGLVFYDDKFHLFFQHNPFGAAWGNMSWGHAVSEDLIHWTELDVAIPSDPDNLGYIFSGSTVVDVQNSSGLQSTEHPPLVALYTNHSTDNVQMQSIAVSTDGGVYWQKYRGNPVIPNPGIKDFRDPKVFWHAASEKWIMILAAGQNIKFYQSDNLIGWQFVSCFGEDQGCHLGEWECPDLFELPTTNGQSKWVLLVSINPGGPNSGSGTQYFIGNFDGSHFNAEHDDVRWLDFGPDNYAGVTWDGLQQFENRRIYVAWMSNWSYASELPTSPWRGAMTIPRELRLQQCGSEYLISSAPVREIEALLKNIVSIESTDTLTAGLPSDKAYRINFQFGFNKNDKPLLSFENELGEKLIIKYLPKLNKIVMDRRNAGWNLKLWTMPLIEANVQSRQFDSENASTLSGQLIVDMSSIELFWHDGTTSLTANVFPTEAFNKITFSTESSAKKSLTVDIIEAKHEA